MSDPLNPIRRLYAEPPDLAGGAEPDHITNAQERELSALRPVREALDMLPRQRPPRTLIDETVARATFAAVRKAYGDDVGSPLPPNVAREAEALGVVRSALESLPAERPDEEVVDLVVARAVVGDVRAAYDEDAPQRLPASVAQEAAALVSVKNALDALPRERPDPAVIDRIVALAATSEASRKRRRRSAVAPARPARAGRRRRAGVLAGTVAALFIAVATFMIIQPDEPEQIAAADTTPAPDEWAVAVPEAPPNPEPEAEVEPQAIEESQPQPRTQPTPAAPPPQPAAQPTTRPGEALAMRAGLDRIPPAGHTALPTPTVEMEHGATFVMTGFETDDEALRLLYLRLQALRAAGMDWDEPESVLGLPPSGRPAATRGWMQVRTER